MADTTTPVEQLTALTEKAQEISAALEGKSLDAEAITEINEKLESLTSDQKALKEQIEGSSLEAEDVKAVVSGFEELNAEVGRLKDAREKQEAELERKAMVEKLDELGQQVAAAADGKLPSDFFPTAPPSGTKALYGENGEYSYYNDIRLAREEGDHKARERIEEATGHEGKAMGEGTDATGGFLVPPELSDQLIPLRDNVSVLRRLFTTQQVSSDAIRFIAQDSGLAVAWTAEFAQKIKTDLSFSEFEAHIYTAAGLALTSNQLLADAKWSVDQMITTDLAKRFVSLEEQAFINGSGTGQPLGIMNTPGVLSVPYTEAEPSADALLDKISEGITDVQTEFLGFPDAIVMHPRTWGYITRARESESPSTYFIGAGANSVGRRPSDPLPGYNGGTVPRGELFGLPVYCTPNIPTNLGDEEDESAVIVGDFSQGLVLDREGITTETSRHVYFESNQTVFRSEERLGFTAGRYPNAFAVIQGDGLAGK